MQKRKLKWPEALLHYFMTRATPVDGMVWVKPQRSVRPPHQNTLHVRPINGLIQSVQSRLLRRASDGISHASGRNG
jgi:hypothetical protein